MRDAELEQLKQNRGLVRFIDQCARRHFGASDDDREDAAAVAWARIWRKPAGLSLELYRHEAYNAIRALYGKVHRRKKREAPVDLSGDAPSSALHALAQRAIEGDW